MIGLIFIILGSYSLYLVWTQQMLFYIHPRFIDLSIFTGMFLLIVGILSIYFFTQQLRKSRLKKELLLTQVKQNWHILLLTVIIFILPKTSLTSATANQRTTNFNTLPDTPISLTLPASTQNLGLKEWVSLISSAQKPELLIGKEAVITGFIFQSSVLPEGYFMVTRFRVTCCALDATPIGIPVKYQWKEKFQQDDWVKVIGTIGQETVNDETQIIIIPTSVDKISQPTDPYVY